MKTLQTVADLLDAGLVPPDRRKNLERVAARYAVAVTPSIASLIDPDNPADPIARQFIPSLAELDSLPIERTDPIGDAAHSPVEGIVHRYPDRVLLKAVSVCAVYCRFCFRREMVGPQHAQLLSGAALDTALAYIQEHKNIWEVILTGGDPFMMSPRRIADIFGRLTTADHVKILRLHTRVPAVAPERVTDALVAALRSTEKTVFVALHANHPDELTRAVRAACKKLVDAGIAMVSQTVLLRGVNDDADTLAALMRGFVEMRIKPYYLHHGDLAPGTAHFRTTIAEGQAIMRSLAGRVSGLCQPAYVLDIPGGYGKTPIGPASLAAAGAETLKVRDYQGAWHDYPEDVKS